MSDAFITITPEAEEHILSFADDSRGPLSLSLTWGLKVTDRNGRVVLHDQDSCLQISRGEATENCVALNIRGHTIHMRLADLRQVVGRTIYLSKGHSSDPSVTCGDLLKVTS